MLGTQSLRRFVKTGHLTVIDARGARHEFGEEPGPSATIRLTTPSVIRKLFLHPQISVGEAYVDGTLVLEEGTTLHDFLDLAMANLRHIEKVGYNPYAAIWRNALASLRYWNPVGAARRKVSHHYDLKPALFDLFLDADRQYSCAYFAEAGDDLDLAQSRKKLHLAAKLLLRPGQRVLDIGSGWGGLGLLIAKTTKDVQVDGVTLSHEQHKGSNERAWRAGLSERVRFHLRDYREIEERYDRIVSVGMLEHVGAHHYREFYRKVRDLLTDDGVAVIHSVGKFDEPGPMNPWIDKYIFPGAYTPTLSEQLPAIEDAGLYVTDVEILRRHYAETLAAWRRNFVANLDAVREMYDERFCRMWDFYLVSCELAFRHGLLMVFQIQLSKQLDTVPQTRDYIGRFEREHAQDMLGVRIDPPMRDAGD